MTDKLFAVLGASSIIKHGVMYYMQDKKPDNLELVGKVSSLKLYPAKSMGEIDIRKANCTKIGLEYNGFHDRRWVLLDKDNSVVTLKNFPRLAFVSCQLNGTDIIFSFKNESETIKISRIMNNNNNTNNYDKNTTQFKYRDYLDAYNCGEEVNVWFNKYLNMDGGPFKLYYFPVEVSSRLLSESNSLPENLRRLVQSDDAIGVHNDTPYLLTTDESLKDISNRVERVVTVKNFRSNITVVGTKEPFDEDNWDIIYIGEARFKSIKQCSRCPLITVNHDDGTKDKNDEPMKTLKTYRIPKGSSKVAFGINLLLEKSGTISIGDKVFVKRKVNDDEI